MNRKARAKLLKTTSNSAKKYGRTGKAWEAERNHLQDELNRIHDRWMEAISKGDLDASEGIWQELDQAYQKMKLHLPITPPAEIDNGIIDAVFKGQYPDDLTRGNHDR